MIQSVCGVEIKFSAPLSPSLLFHSDTGTHDIMDCSTMEEANGIAVIVNFTEHSKATGALLNFIFVNEDGETIDFKKSFFHATEKINDQQYLQILANVSFPGMYIIYAYDIESNQEIMNGLYNYDASNHTFMVNNDQGMSDLIV